MNRKPWPILVGIALVLLLAAAALLGRPRSAAPTDTLAPALTPSPLVTALPKTSVPLSPSPASPTESPAVIPTARPTATERPTAVPPTPTPTLPPLARDATPVTLRELHPETITDTVDAGLEDFVFGPTRVITDRRITHLGGWLPDNEHLLVSWYITPVPPSPGDALEEIGIYNVRTGEFVEYAQRQWYGTEDDFIWLPAIQQVAFRDGLELWISGTGTERAVEPILTNMEYPFEIAATDSEAIIVLSTTHQLATIDAQGTLTPLPVDLDELGINIERSSPCPFRMRSSPDRSKIALVGCVNRTQVHLNDYMLYLINLTDYSTQAFNLGPNNLEVVWRIEWSLDGNYIALVKQRPNYIHGLWILNVRGAELAWMDVKSWNVIWSPDERYLIMFDSNLPSYFLVDVQTGARLPVLANSPCQKPPSSDGGNWWSAENNRLVLLDQYHLWLCLVDITYSGGDN